MAVFISRHHDDDAPTCYAVLEVRPLDESAVLAELLDPEYESYERNGTVDANSSRHATKFNNDRDTDDDDGFDDGGDGGALSSSCSSTGSSSIASSGRASSGDEELPVVGGARRRARPPPPPIDSFAVPLGTIDYWRYLDGLCSTRRAVRARIVDDLDADVEDGLREVRTTRFWQDAPWRPSICYRARMQHGNFYLYPARRVAVMTTATYPAGRVAVVSPPDVQPSTYADVRRRRRAARALREPQARERRRAWAALCDRRPVREPNPASRAVTNFSPS